MQNHRLLYRSDAALAGSSEEVAHHLRSIVEDAKTRNAAAKITGALLLSAGVFIQALEGPLEAIEQTFERICRDLRHRRVQLLELAAAEQRAFGQWSLAQITLTHTFARIGPATPETVVSQIDTMSADAVVDLMRSHLLSETDPVLNCKRSLSNGYVAPAQRGALNSIRR